VAARWLGLNPPDGPVLRVEDAGPVAEVMERLGIEHLAWHREARGGVPATPWPSIGPFETVVLRLPKGRESQRMALSLAASRLRPGGLCLVHGHNDEGIKSARKPAAEFFSEVEAVDARKHCRLVACRGPLQTAPGALEDWSRPVRASVGDRPLEWTSWPGLFAHGRLDDGSALLLRSMGPIDPGTRVLDWACGAGVLAMDLHRRNPELVLDLLDVDALALHAARQNLPAAHRFWLADAWQGVEGSWDLIVSNPPLHAGVKRNHIALHQLVGGAPSRLTAHGALWMVVQRNVSLREPLSEGFKRVGIVASTSGFRVWKAQEPR